MAIVRFHQMGPEAEMPRRAHRADAGFDLAVVDGVSLEPGERGRFGTRLQIEIESGFCGFVVSRSGLAADLGLVVLNAPGVVDAGYRGELEVVLANLGQALVDLPPLTRVAQLIVVQIAPNEAQAGEADEPDRGTHGFGSSGYCSRPNPCRPPTSALATEM